MRTKISIHAPLTGRDNIEKRLQTLYTKFQSTRPLRGATKSPRLPFHSVQISIHAPLTGRDVKIVIQKNADNISIHAPLTGRDAVILLVLIGLVFQSTRPLRGATREKNEPATNRQISIHAPLTGRDRRNIPEHRRIPISIHAPLTGRDARPACSFPYPGISIHAPLTGRDRERQKNARSIVISIHAPLTGRDPALAAAPRRVSHFNPRAPYGARQQKCTNNLLHFCYNRQFKQKIHLYSIVCQNAIP